MEKYKFNEALQDVFSLVHAGNAYIDREKPWQGENYKMVIPRVVYLIVNIAWLLVPFMPQTAEKIFKQLNVNPSDNKAWENKKLNIIKGESLFPRV